MLDVHRKAVPQKGPAPGPAPSACPEDRLGDPGGGGARGLVGGSGRGCAPVRAAPRVSVPSPRPRATPVPRVSRSRFLL